MNTARLDKLKQFTEEEPDDPFNWYALAMEYLKFDRSRALEILNELIRNHPSYLPTYYQAGLLQAAHGNPDEARRILEHGWTLAQKQQDGKTARELRAAIEALDED